jgi:hypothetical protein
MVGNHYVIEKPWNASSRWLSPAWKEVWICTNPKGHLQATGRDARGENKAGTIPSGQKCEMKPNMNGCCSSERPFRGYASALARFATEGTPASEVTGDDSPADGDDAYSGAQPGVCAAVGLLQNGSPYKP